ncbi:hypothetical protein IJ596_02310 [bacterium]|nr:hypothetical protein [bacterium]
MQVYSINSGLSCCKPRTMMNNEPQPAPQPAPAPAPAPQPEKPEEGKASIYFGNSDDKSSRGMKWLLIPAASLALAGPMLSSCEDEPTYAHAEAIVNDTVNVNVNTNGNGGCGGRDTIRDTVYIDRTKHDTCYVDTGSYHVSHDTIVKWRDHFVRPIPLDSIMKNLSNWGIDGTNGANIFDGSTNRNIIHYTAQHNWELNDIEKGDIDLLESNKNRLVYRTEILNFKKEFQGYGALVFRIPTSSFTVETASGKKITSPRGYFVEEYENNTGNKWADLSDCERTHQRFVQTTADGKILNVYTRNDKGVYVYDGDAAEGYLEKGTSILLKNLLGAYDNERHLIDVHVSACNDEILKDLYIRQMDDAYAESKGLK